MTKKFRDVFNSVNLNEDLEGFFKESIVERIYINHKTNQLHIKLVLNKIVLMKAYNLNMGVILILHKKNYKSVLQQLQILDSLGVSLKINRGVDVINPDCENSEFELNADELFNVAKEVCYYMFAHKRFREDVLYQKMIKYIVTGGENLRH